MWNVCLMERRECMEKWSSYSMKRKNPFNIIRDMQSQDKSKKMDQQTDVY